MDDGILGDLLLVNLVVDLSRFEKDEYDSLQTRLGALKARLASEHPEWFVHLDWTGAIAAAARENVDAKRLNALVGERRRLLSKSSSRLSALKVLIDEGLLDGRRSIFRAHQHEAGSFHASRGQDVQGLALGAGKAAGGGGLGQVAVEA